MKKNILGLLGLFTGIIGIILSIFFYEGSRKDREPTFIVDPIKSEILDISRTNLAPLKILKTNGEEIKSNVTITTFYFWNKGKQPIVQTDILEKVKFHFKKGTKIIDYKLLKTSREICKIDLAKINENVLELNFNILEKNDGFTCQIIFEGDKTSELLTSGIYVGVNEVSSFAMTKYQLLGNTLINIGLGILAIFGFILAFFFMGATSSKGMYEPDYVIHKNSERYTTDAEFKKYVDNLESVENQISELRDKAYGKEEPSIEDQENRKKRLKFWLRIGVSVGILVVIGLMIYAWFITKNEIIENPSQYIPSIIKP